MRIGRSGLWSLCMIVALAAACSKTPEPTADSRPAAPPAGTSTAKGPDPSTAKGPAPTAQGPSEVAWDAPAGWETAPNPNPMRKATYKIKRAEGDPEDAELSVSQAGGGVDANIARWAGQFQQKAGADETKRSERKVGNLKVTVVDVRGTFSGSGMPGMPAAAPKPGWALLGAIVELPGGATWFFKLTGPEKTVSAASSDFDKLLDSLRPK